MTKDEFQRIWIFLGKHFPRSGRYKDKQSYLSYYIALKPIEAETVERAAAKWVRNGNRYFPDVADLVTAVRKETVVRVDAAGVLGNVRAWAIVTGRTMPEGMTAAEALRWYERQQMEAM